MRYPDGQPGDWNTCRVQGARQTSGSPATFRRVPSSKNLIGLLGGSTGRSGLAATRCLGRMVSPWQIGLLLWMEVGKAPLGPMSILTDPVAMHPVNPWMVRT